MLDVQMYKWNSKLCLVHKPHDEIIELHSFTQPLNCYSSLCPMFISSHHLTILFIGMVAVIATWGWMMLQEVADDTSVAFIIVIPIFHRTYFLVLNIHSRHKRVYLCQIIVLALNAYASDYHQTGWYRGNALGLYLVGCLVWILIILTAFSLFSSVHLSKCWDSTLIKS
jgi:hypothetical protein